MNNGLFWGTNRLIKYVETYDKDFQPPKLYFHILYEVYYLLENDIIYFYDNTSFHMKAGSFIVTPPNVIHYTRSLYKKNRKRILIYVPNDIMDEFLTVEPDLLDAFLNGPVFLRPSQRKVVEEMLYSLLNDYQSENGSKLFQKSLLGEILITLKRNTLENIALNEKRRDVDTEDAESNRILEIVKYINENYSEKITLDSLSKKFFLNPSYISRAFKNKLNISFNNYLRSVRIREIAVLLQDTDLDIKSIAFRTGFESSTALCRTFKSAMGVTPLSYRNNYRK